MIHHELVAEVAAVLSVSHSFVHQTVDEGDPAVNGKRHGQLLVGSSETWSTSLIAQLCHAEHIIPIFDRKAQDVPVGKAPRFKHGLFKRGLSVVYLVLKPVVTSTSL